MSDMQALVEEKTKLINQMLEMQKKFMDADQGDGIAPESYFAGDEGDFVGSYKEKYDKLATRLVDLAHQIVGSKR